MSSEESNIAVVAERMKGLASDMAEMKSAMKQLTDAVKQLAVIEVRQTEAIKATERAFVEIDKVDGRVVAIAARVSSLEQAQPLQKQTSEWVSRVVGMIVMAVAGALIGWVVLTPPKFTAPQVQTTGK